MPEPVEEKYHPPNHSTASNSSTATAAVIAVTAADPATTNPANLTAHVDPPVVAQSSVEEASKKKSRLQWDEDNLISNAQEMERAGPRMKIDEPKTPFVQGSETGSSTSGSAHQSPPESPSFIPGERLVGFQTLEANMHRSGGGGGAASSDGASSGGSAGRSVQISDDFAHSSGGSSPRSKELFAARRKAHYRNEAARMRKSVLTALDADGDASDDSDEDRSNGHQNGTEEMNGVNGTGQSVRARLAVLNEEVHNQEARSDGGGKED